MRKYAWQIAGAIVNIALDIALAKGWADKIPNPLVFCLFVLSLAPIIWWLFTHEKLVKHREYVGQQFSKSKVKFTFVAALFLIPVLASGVLGSVWLYRRVMAFVSQPIVAKIAASTGTIKTSTPNASGAASSSGSEHKQVAQQPEHKLVPHTHVPRQGSDKGTHSTPEPQGGAGVEGDSVVVEMSGSSQIAGYQTGVLGDHAHVVMKDQSRIEKTPTPTPPPPAPVYRQNWATPEGPTLSGIGIKVPRIDMPLDPVPVGASSVSSTNNQMDAINALVKEWRDTANWTFIGRNAIRWVNQRLEEQGKDFRVKMPEHCPPYYPGVAGVSVPSGRTLTLEGVKIEGTMVGVVAGKSEVQMDNTQVVANDNCD